MEKHYQKILRDTQDRVYESMRTQILDKNDPYYGSFAEDSGIRQAKYAIYRMTSMISCYECEDSKFYNNEKIFERIMAAMQYIQSVQHENGLFDYVTCNFKSAPDTAFCIKRLMPLFFYLKDKKRNDKEEQMFVPINQIIERAAHGICEGGFHTPNHRWAIASTLLECAKIYDDEEMRIQAAKYLAEGIDGNEDGEYAEKSAGNYNRVNNDAMITLAEATGDEKYEEYVIRNLNLMLHYWEPDGSVFTANSTRFDKDMVSYPTDYYTEYFLMAQRHDIPEFYQMCNRIMDICNIKNIKGPDCLDYFLLHPEWRGIEQEGSYVEPDYYEFYKWSGISRNHSGHYTYTIMKGKSKFLYMNVGTMKMSMKVTGSFCEHRAFYPETMEQIPGGYHLHQTMHGWYYLPWSDEKRPDTNDWWAMDNASRDKKWGPDMEVDVYITETKEKDGLDVRVVTNGVDGDPWRVELAFAGATFVENDHLATEVDGSQAITIKDGYTQVTNHKDTLEIGPAFATHHFMAGKEDSEPKTEGATTLYFADYTGFDHTIKIRNLRTIFEQQNTL